MVNINIDEEIDKKTISAIHFLLENQHRSGLLDGIFWLNAIKEKELKTAIPMTAEVAIKSDAEKYLGEKVTASGA